MDVLQEYLPPHPGMLPKWLLFTSVLSIFNGIQNYVTLDLTRRVYSGETPATKDKPASSPVTPLTARLFAAWTTLSAVIRIYAAYHIQDRLLYQLTLWTFAIASFHFWSEYLYFKSAKIGAGLLSPLTVGTSSTIWMLMQWGHYVH